MGERQPGRSGAGQQVRLTVQYGGHTFVGIADLILRNKCDGMITVVDHKSKSMPSMKKDIAAYRKQLYVYAAHVTKAFGEYPALQRFAGIWNHLTTPFVIMVNSGKAV